MTGRFYINGVDLFTQYGITVLNSEGEVDLEKPKKKLETDWPDDHGLDVDAAMTYFEAKEITLECMLKQSTAAEALTKLRALQVALTNANLKQLKSFKDSPRVHMVYLNDSVKVERFEAGKILLFKLKFMEPIPHGKQYSVTGAVTVTVDLDTTETEEYYAVDIYWGDGAVALGAKVGLEYGHTYLAGSYTLVISGSYEKADELSVTNATPI